MGSRTKKVDSKVRQLIEKCVELNQRSLLFIIGDKGRLQVSNFHYLLSKITNSSKPTVLWCYKKKLQVSSNRSKRLKIAKKLAKKASYDAEIEDPFELFLSTTDIRYCLYKDTKQILGQTFNMLVLQDFEALTPNIMCRTIETIKGGGIILFLLDTIASLESIYSITMDAHNKYSTARFRTCESRFIKRMILSLTKNPNALVVDDELNILPIINPKQINGINNESKHNESIIGFDSLNISNNEIDDKFSGPKQLHSITCTRDQGETFYRLLDILINKRGTQQYTAITAGRGRGKSAVLGLAIASALSLGYSNIYVAAPVADNVATLFEFVIKGLETLGFKSHTDFIIYSLDKEEIIPIEVNNLTRLFTGSRAKTTRVTTQIVFNGSVKQSVTYLSPDDLNSWNSTFANVELLVIDEAAAIPIHLLRKCKGNFITLLSSTVDGYEGTGRVLSLRLFNELESNHGLLRLEMSDPIRYSSNDPVENWLTDLLCLKATIPPKLGNEISSPDRCELFQVDRDALMSFHPCAESFLHSLKATFISSHYKNSPDDFMLMSDSPSHALFVLISPIDRMNNGVPNVICAIQISLEGRLTKDEISESMNSPKMPAGDLIPWTLTQYYTNEDFASLSGVRIVRISVHPHLQRMGYGTHALKLLIDFITSYNKDKVYKTFNNSTTNPLLVPCEEAAFGIDVDYIGASFGLTCGLIKFWNKLDFHPVYLKQIPNEVIGEHSCIVIRPVTKSSISSKNPKWFSQFAIDFSKRLLALLPGPFSKLPLRSLNFLLFEIPESERSKDIMQFINTDSPLSLSFNDLDRLDRYARQFSQLRSILDILPLIALLIFTGRFKIELSILQKIILLGIACQMKKPEDIALELDLPSNQIMSILHRFIFNINSIIRELITKDIENKIIN